MARLNNRLRVLQQGSPRQRQAARIGQAVYETASQIGPHQIAADYGLPPDADLPLIAHVYATQEAPPPFIDVAAEFAEYGFRRHEAFEQAEYLLHAEAMRAICAEHGPWAMGMPGTTIGEIAMALAEQNDDCPAEAIFDGAMQGFAENLLFAHKLIEPRDRLEP
jgi:hypothetical protein